jgi:hypothetical protein
MEKATELLLSFARIFASMMAYNLLRPDGMGHAKAKTA